MYQTKEGSSLKIHVEMIEGRERAERGEEAPILHLLFSSQNYAQRMMDKFEKHLSVTEDTKILIQTLIDMLIYIKSI